MRFARERLGARDVLIEAPGDANLLARAAAAVLPGVSLARAHGADAGFSWSNAVSEGRETWPIQYLVPGGAGLRVEAAPSSASPPR